MELADRVAIVTGAGRGIGRACALKLAASGAHVASVDIDSETAASTAAAVEASGRRALAVEADLGDLAGIDRMVESVMSAFGRIDCIVNNAGITRRAGFMELIEDDWDRIHRVNAKGVFFCMQRAAAEMIRQRQGRIINIASIAGKGYIGSSNAIYAASKGAVLAMTKVAAHQLGQYNINVNAICPGITRTEIYQEIVQTDARKSGRLAEDIEREAIATVPIGRANEPDDVGDLAVFLASPRSRNMTGQSFNIDGGLIMD
ncbi:MAG: SDR family NAD(P)-dependent oxidoreductase [Hyphomicrobiaceae bacterium]